MLLYCITDRHQLAPADKASAVERLVEAAALAGVDYIQLREKDLSARELERLATRCMAHICDARKEGSRTRLLVNSRVDIAIACGADGVHLRSRASGELSAADARAIFGRAGRPQPIIAVSCHSAGEVLLAESEGADFAVFGPVFGKGERAGVGIDALRRICHRTPNHMPVLALGGITIESAASCVAAGAAGVAAIRLFQSADVQAAIHLLRTLAKA
ncbi:MAG TPA: thiamine phosphate synthase [Terriglobales bacterium]|nr:thiamine phosphate synthase [Terriglobales bacterium]